MDDTTAWHSVLSSLDSIHRRRTVARLGESTQSEPAVRVPEDVHEGETEIETLQSELYHRHLPKLERHGYIEWDDDRHLVRKGDDFDEIFQVLEAIREVDRDLPDNWL